MPVVGHLAVADAKDVRGDEVDRLTGASLAIERSAAVSSEVKVEHYPVTDDQSLDDLALEVGNGREETLRGDGGSGRSLRPAGRKRVVDEVLQKALVKECGTAVVPEAVEGIDGGENLSELGRLYVLGEARCTCTILGGRFQWMQWATVAPTIRKLRSQFLEPRSNMLLGFFC